MLPLNPTSMKLNVNEVPAPKNWQPAENRASYREASHVSGSPPSILSHSNRLRPVEGSANSYWASHVSGPPPSILSHSNRLCPVEGSANSYCRGPPPPIPYHTKPVFGSHHVSVRDLPNLTQSEATVASVASSTLVGTTGETDGEASVTSSSTFESLNSSFTLTTGETGGELTSNLNSGNSGINHTDSEEEYWRGVNNLDEESLNSQFATMTVSNDLHEVQHGPETSVAESLNSQFATMTVSSNLHEVQHSPETSVAGESYMAYPFVTPREKKKKYYCVTRGHKVGVFDSWIVTKPLVTGVDAVFQSFPSFKKALRMYNQARELGTLEIIVEDS